MDVAFILGPAGSGKTYLTAALAYYLDQKNIFYATLNLDPAVEDPGLKYDPTIDVRDWVRTSQVMKEFKLGPNGEIIASMDILAGHADKIKKAIIELKPDILLVDTSGQLEVFAFRPSGYEIFRAINEIEGTRSLILFLIDPFLCKSGLNAILSVLLLSSSIFWRFQLPVIDVVTKRDLLPSEELDKILYFLENPSAIFDELEVFAMKDLALQWEAMVSQFEEIFSRKEIIAVSSETGEGIADLFAKMQEVWSKSGGVET